MKISLTSDMENIAFFIISCINMSQTNSLLQNSSSDEKPIDSTLAGRSTTQTAGTEAKGLQTWVTVVVVISSILVALAIAFGLSLICVKDQEALPIKARPKSLEAEEERKNEL